MDDSELFQTIRTELFTAVVGDVLDVVGHRHQFLPPGITPLQSGTCLVGRAMPVVESDLPASSLKGAGTVASSPFGLMFEALDDLKPGEIYIATGASLNYALWGGLMSTRAMHLKAAGAILDGFVRDANEIESLGFPVFSRGLYAQDQGPRGKVTGFRTPIEIAGISIEPGTLIHADREGVLVIPRDIESEVVRLALEKVRTENLVARAIRDGVSACQAYKTYGVM